MLHLNIPLILILMVKTRLSFGYIQDKLKEVDEYDANNPYYNKQKF